MAAFLLVGLLFVWGLSGAGLLSVDEPRYAAIGRAMAETGNWVTPTLWGAPWLEKPPLLFWLIGAATKLGLRDEWAVRAPVAVLSAVFLLFFYIRLKRLFDGRLAFRATAILATSAGWFAFSQVAVTDLPLAAAFSAAMLLTTDWAVRGGPKSPGVAAGIVFGLAILAKAAVPVALALPLLYWAGRRWPRLALPAIVALVVAAPWYWLCYRANGWPFIEELFVRHHLARFITGETLHARPWWFYVPVLAMGLLPWAPLVAGLKAREVWEDRRLRFFLLWFGWGFVFFSVASGKLPGYLLPLFPAAAVLLAAGVERSRIAMGLAAALPVLVLPVALAIIPVAVDRGLARALAGGTGGLLVAVAFAIAAGLLVACARTPARRFAMALAITVALLVAGKPRLLRGLDMTASARREAGLVRTELARLGNPPVCRGELRRTWEYQLQYYLGPIPPCADETQAVRIESTPEGELVLRRGDDGWRRRIQ